MSQYAAVVALKDCKKDIEYMRNEYDMRRRLIVKGFNEMGLDCFEPEGAFYIFPSIRKTGLSSQEFCEQRIESLLSPVTLSENAARDISVYHMHIHFSISRQRLNA